MRISPHQGLENINIINTMKIVPILIVFGTLVVFLPYIKHVPTYAQTFDNAITFPDVNVTDSKNQNIPLEYEFLLVGNNTKSP
ncbi:MAG TPA: hypothetical protein VN704_07315, partial [Verrucomicrobiae bacterium]|nr:hypothetical protein [Verrucomicrobiae bacterium]